MKTRKYRKLKSRKRNKMSKHRRKRYSNRKTRRKSYNGGYYDKEMEEYAQKLARLESIPRTTDNIESLTEEIRLLKNKVNYMIQSRIWARDEAPEGFKKKKQ